MGSATREPDDKVPEPAPSQSEYNPRELRVQKGSTRTSVQALLQAPPTKPRPSHKAPPLKGLDRRALRLPGPARESRFPRVLQR